MTSTSTTTSASSNVTEHKFGADIASLMNIIVHSFYSKKDIFLRELISNASDSLDKIRYQSLTDETKLAANKNLEIHIKADPINKTLCITDSGVGMTGDELISNLGTIAKSGTKAFMDNIKSANVAENTESDDKMGLIGRFGVGFYSSYLVADNVVVESKSTLDDKQHKWESSANGTYNISESNNSNIIRGTSITLHIKEDCLEYCNYDVLEKIIKEHSQFINFPIFLWKKTGEEEVKSDVVEEVANSDNKENGQVEDEKEDTEKTTEDIADKKEKQMVDTFGWVLMNEQKPIWTRRPADITDEEYLSFYKSLDSVNGTEYYSKIHFATEGELEFKALVYIPKEPSFDMFGGDSKNKKTGVKLYARRVFITDKIEGLLPEYLGFVKGIIDSDDLPLNVSREMLQQNKIIKTMSRTLIKRLLDNIKELSENEEEYLDFFNKYSKNLKLGVHEDDKNRDKLIELLRWPSCADSTKLISLDAYVTNMKPDQKNIYYISGESMDKVADSPFLEKLKAKGYDVLLLVDPIDEYAIQRIPSYKDKELVSITKEGLDLGTSEEEKKEQDSHNITMANLCKFMKDTLGDKVDKVEVSASLTESPCVITTSKFGWSANMERIMKAQALGNKDMLKYMAARKILGINPNNKIISELNKKITNDENDSSSKDITVLLYETALLDSGFTIEKTNDYTRRVHRIIKAGLLIDDDSDDADIVNNRLSSSVDNHSHEHTHADGHSHIHEHSHEHGHEHEHEHEHNHDIIDEDDRVNVDIDGLPDLEAIPPFVQNTSTQMESVD